MGTELKGYITAGSAALSALISIGIIMRILLTIINNMSDENAVLEGSIVKKVKRLLKALAVMLAITGITTYLYIHYFSVST